jgi:hypothetical protein
MKMIFRLWPCVIGALATSALGQNAGIHERTPPGSYTFVEPRIELREACAAGGQNAYLVQSGTSHPSKTAVCQWSHSDTAAGSGDYAEKFLYFSGPGHGQTTSTLLGCHVRGTLEFKVAWSDMDDGFDPGQSIFSDPASVMVLLKVNAGPGEHFLLRNSHASKVVMATYTLGNLQYTAPIQPNSSSTLVTSVQSVQYETPYRRPDAGSPCD